MKNISNLFADGRTRSIIIVTLFLLLVAVIAALFTIRRTQTVGPDASARVSGVPGSIRSIPGSLNPTEQYAKLVEQQNVNQAKKAEKSGKSAIPTIVRFEQFGQGKAPITNQGNAGVGFKTLAQLQQEGGQIKQYWLNKLRSSNCSPADLNAAQTQGISTATLLEAGCTAKQLSESGASLNQLRQAGVGAKALRDAGYNASQLRAAGFDAKQLKDAGFSACELKAAGFTAQDLKKAGFNDDELRGAGFTPEEIRQASGLPADITPEEIRQAGCSAEALARERAAGVSAKAIHELANCSASALKAAGFSAKDLKDAGFTPAQLKAAGFDAKALKDAGFTASQLHDAGFSNDDLKEAGFDDAAIKAAEQSKLPGGYTADQLRANGCNVEALKRERAAGVSAADIRRIVGCDAAALKAAGYSARELKDAGFSAKQLKDAGFSAKDLKDAGFTANQLKDAGFTPKELKDAGFSAEALKNAGFTAKQLKDAGFTPKELKDAGFSAEALKDAGFTANQLKNAGFNAKQLKDAGFTASQLKAAGFNANQLKDAGFDAKQLKDAGFNARELSNAGFGEDDLKNAGFSNQQLANAGVLQDSGSDDSNQSGSTSDADKQLQAVLARQAQQQSSEKYQQVIKAREAVIRSQANSLLSGWGNVATQVYAAGNERAEAGSATAAGAQAAAAGQAGDSTSATPLQTPPATLKAGDVLFATLITSVNSDDAQTPILARIVAGKYKGAKLIGAFSKPNTNAKRIILQFTTMSIAEKANTISINAVAIDPNTAQAALSSKTDSHTLLRYGSLFASSFLEGLGQAVQQQGQTFETTAGGSGFRFEQSSRSGIENAVVALGRVGQRTGTVLQPLFNRPPTVYVYSGTGLGILFLQDVTI